MDDLILINETDNIYEQLTNKGINYSKFKDKLKILNNTKLNNMIGYFKINSDGNFYKICILPKIIDKRAQNLSENFGQYINITLGLILKYKLNNYKLLKDNYLDLIHMNRLGNIEKLDYLLESKYIQALNYIEFFFNQYKKYDYIDIKFSDLIIKGKIDIRRNILEVNKARVHQIRQKEILYSKIADITISVLKYFENFKMKLIRHNKKIQLKLHDSIRTINQKFLIKAFHYTIDMILSNKSYKLFNKPELKQLYLSLLILLDLDGYFESNIGYINVNNVCKMASIVINPSYIFEYYVYDYYINHTQKYKDIKFIKIDKEVKLSIRYLKKIEKDSLEIESKIGELNDQWREKMSKLWILTTSEPDLVIKELSNNDIWYDTVVDCKWKILDKSIDKNDLEKLKIDCKSRNINRGKLVYPLIKTAKYKSVDSFEIDDERFSEGIFRLTIEECKMI
ncbi:hypothetical protein [Clostridium manihotivorum]|uniref:Uncharacterized protein n=1 Tax=Clostridium manihotivorum TaxID=2320868 RepID=A0A410DQK7_9CLOT|nr:hypothetical protein [Clostridium manihotivorum]QAA31332.1 hypothetical protein C1I91_06565 [Clostridium manihotivorum]